MEPTIEQVKLLDGKIFAILSDEELDVLNYFRTRGRKFGVVVTILSEANPEELKRAKSEEQADEIIRRANSKISIQVS